MHEQNREENYSVNDDIESLIGRLNEIVNSGVANLIQSEVVIKINLKKSLSFTTNHYYGLNRVEKVRP